MLREPQGAPLTAVAPERITDAVLDDVWRNIARLHDMRIAHGGLRAANVLLLPDGTHGLRRLRAGVIGCAGRSGPASTRSSSS